jgi:hypothetical protein
METRRSLHSFPEPLGSTARICAGRNRNEANERTRPMKERKFARPKKHKSGQAPFRASLSARRRASLFRLVGHGIVSEKSGTAFRYSRRIAAPAPRFVVEGRLRGASRSVDFLAQDHGFRDFLHRLAHLLALPLQRAVGFFFADFHLALQDSLGALDQLARFELAGQR